MRVSGTFDRSVTRSLVARGLSGDRTYQDNVDYLATEYGEAIREVPRLARAAELSDRTRVYAGRVVNLSVYVALEDGAVRLVFVAPFTS
jgi:hypothetical protein